MISELHHRYQRIFIHQFNNFYIRRIWIYLATFTIIFVKNCSFS